MTLRDLLKKKDKIQHEANHASASSNIPGPPPEFTLIRSDTLTQEVIHPPSAPSTNEWPLGPSEPSASDSPPRTVKRPSSFRSHSARSAAPADSRISRSSSYGGREKRLSTLLRLRSHSGSHSSRSSAHLPADLPAIDDDGGASGADAEAEREAKWTKRATMLAESSLDLGLPVDAASEDAPVLPPIGGIPDAEADDIHKAIELHERGDLEASTAMLSRLADPQGANHPLAQVLYGLALRHGWGITPDTGRAVTYLSQAATHGAAAAQAAAKKEGKEAKGGAKIQGELVLALYELANCFRHGWGVPTDPVAARSYYETAGNLGDADALAEAGWCFEHGFGGKKDKFLAAKYYRRAEEKGNKILGNSWIWKDKYNEN